MKEQVDISRGSFPATGDTEGIEPFLQGKNRAVLRAEFNRRFGRNPISMQDLWSVRNVLKPRPAAEVIIADFSPAPARRVA